MSQLTMKIHIIRLKRKTVLLVMILDWFKSNDLVTDTSVVYVS